MMKVKVLLVLTVLLHCIVAQEYQTIFYIDDFTIDTPEVVVISEANTVVFDKGVSTGDSLSIIGTERDVVITVMDENSGNVYTSGVIDGYYYSVGPSGGEGLNWIQWDGTDDSGYLYPSGLGGLDFTVGNANGVKLSALSASSVIIEINFYSGGYETICSAESVIPGDGEEHDLFIDYGNFTNGCDLQNIGSVEIYTELNSGTFVQIGPVSVYTIVSEESSPSISITPQVSPSNIPTPSRSASVNQNECESNSDCDYLENSCTKAECENKKCTTKPALNFPYCCDDTATCVQNYNSDSYCENNFCVLDNSSNYSSNEISNSTVSQNESDNSIYIIIGVTVGSAVLCCVCSCMIIVLVIVIFKWKTSKSQSFTELDDGIEVDENQLF